MVLGWSVPLLAALLSRANLPACGVWIVLDLRIARQPVGYLINFGHKDALEWRRFILSDLNARNTDQR